MSNELDRRFLLGGLAGAAGAAALAGVARGGPLNPPGGGVASSGKALTEVEPRTAVTPAMAVGGGYNLPAGGSYYLTGNITVANTPTAIGIFLNARSTLDLNGFTIVGTGGGTAIRAAAGCTIRNGFIRNTGAGVSHYFVEDADLLIEDLAIESCTYRGVICPIRTTVRRCRLLNCSPVGIECNNDHAQVEDCTVVGSSGVGVYLNAYSRLRGCTITALTAGAGGPTAGGGGAVVGPGSVVERCVFNACSGSGLQASTRVLVSDCNAFGTVAAPGGAPGIGFDLGDGSEIVRSNALQNVIGIRSASAGRVADCSADGNTSAAIKLTGSSAVIESCRLTRNAIAIDMTGATGNYVHKSVLMGNTASIAVNVAGNWYPTVALGGVNTATNPLASVIG